MGNENQLTFATALILGMHSYLVLTAYSMYIYPPALVARQQLYAVQLTRDLESRRTLDHTTLAAITDNIDQEPDEWLSRASKIREEVRELEIVAELSRQGKNIGTTTELSPKNTVDYVDIENSVWTLSYRFANDPEETSDKYNDNLSMSRRVFGGKVTVKYRHDGYTDIISQTSYGSSIDSCKIIKAWGWDIELSKDNENDANMKDQEYIIFSMDVEYPNFDQNLNGESTTTPKSKSERFYFQARKDIDARSGIISLTDGTVTVKRDIVQKSARWGLFSPTGILAQFRYVGEFVAKPVRMTETG